MTTIKSYGPEPAPTPEPLTTDERRDREMLPDGLRRELVRVAEYLEGDNYDRESFEYGKLGAWLDLLPTHDYENREKLLEMIRRLEGASSIKDHWLNLYTEVSRARQVAREDKQLVWFSFGSIVLDAMLAALMPVARAPAVEVKVVVERVQKAAEVLATELRYLRGIGVNVRGFLPGLDDVVAGEDDSYSDSSYEWAKMMAYFALRRYHQELRIEDADDKEGFAEIGHSLVDRTIAHTVGDADSILAVLGVISDRAKQHLNGVRRRPTGDRHIARLLAKELARRFKRDLGNYRYDRAAAIAAAATGEDVSGHALRVMMERPKPPRTRNRKTEK